MTEINTRLSTVDLSSIEQSENDFIGGDFVGKWDGDWTGQALFKARCSSICEVWSFNLASFLNIATPTYQPFIVEKQHVDPGREYWRGSIGLAVRIESDWRNLGSRYAAELNPEIAAKSLALFLFDRHEWGEFALLNGEVVLYDLEFNFPMIRPAEFYLLSPERFSEAGWEHVDEFVEMSEHALQAVANEAREIGIWGQTKEHIEMLAEMSIDEIAPMFELEGHPASEELKSWGIAAFRGRLELVQGFLVD